MSLYCHMGKKKKDPNTCVRIERDEVQIRNCKQYLKEIDPFVQEFAKILQLAGNSVRMKILVLLREEERLCVCDLAEILDMKIPAVSQHLRKLKEGKLLLTEREGTTIYYYINPKFQPILIRIMNRIRKINFV